MRLSHYGVAARATRLLPILALAWIALSPSSAIAACNTTGVAPADVTVTCAANTTTTNSTNSTSPASTSDRIQSFNANLIGQVNSGVTVDGFGLALTTTKVGGSVSFTNNGTISHFGDDVLKLTGNGGGVSYSGNGNLTGTSANTTSLNILDLSGGAGAVTVNATGGTFTANGNSVAGINVFTNNTGGVGITTSGGHSINLVNTFNGSSNHGIFAANTGASGDLVINSGSHIFASGANSLGTIIGIEAIQNGTGKIDVTSSGVIDTSGTTDTGGSGMILTHQGSSGDIIGHVNANVVGGSNGGTGIRAKFANSNTTGAFNISVGNGVSIGASSAMVIDGGGAGAHAATVSIGTGSSITSGSADGLRVQGNVTSLDLTNGGTISTLGNNSGVFVLSGKITGINTGSISGTTGINVNAAGSDFINAGIITGTAGTAIAFTGAGNKLTLRDGTNITGQVLGGTNATFQLGGTTGTPTFDVASLGFQFQGFSTFNKIDSGVWTLTGINAPALPWTVSAGTLNVNGTMAGSTFTVNGGILGGSGAIDNAQINAGGTFAPGNGTPASTMNVLGSLTMVSAATYMVQLNPATASQAIVTGTATLGGATVSATYAAGSYVAKQYTILTAGTVSGTFNPTVANTNLPSNFSSTLSYDATHAYLNLSLNFIPPGSGATLNQNQQNVANTLINYFNTNGSIPLVYGGLSPAGLTQASGELGTGVQQTTVDAMSQFLGLVTDPFIAGRGNGFGGGTGAPAFAAEGEGASSYAAKPRDAFAAIYRKAPPVAADPQRWSIWAAGFGGTQTTDGNAVVGSNSVTSRIAAGAAGADYRVSRDTLIGFALAGGGTNFSLANNLGTGRSDLFQAAGYLRHNMGPAYFTGALAYGWQDVTTDRTVTIAGVDQLRANFKVNAFSGRGEVGYRVGSTLIAVTPYAAGQFTTFDLPAYAEQVVAGTNNFALAYGTRTVTASRSELGVRTDSSWAMPDSVFTLRGRLAWAHDYNPDRNIGATFQALPGASFVVNGAAQGADKALATGSAEIKWVNGFSLAGTFEGEFSSNSRSYAGKGVVRYAW